MPIQVRAQILRDWQAPADAGARQGVVPMSEDAALWDETRAKAPWRQVDVARAITAAEKAGLIGYRVEIGPDGTIAIVVGAPDEPPEN